MTLVLISAVLAVGGSGGLLVFTIFLVQPAVGAERVDCYRPDLVLAWESTAVKLGVKRVGDQHQNQREQELGCGELE